MMKSLNIYIAKALIVLAVMTVYPNHTNALSMSSNTSDGIGASMALGSSKGCGAFNKKEAKEVLKEIKRQEEEIKILLKENAPSKVKERRLAELKELISKYNSFATEVGFQSYASPLFESSIVEQEHPSNSKDIIVLTVSSDGPTKDDAVKNALRTAIEQAFGAFVSANTTILNEELVKDEIVTVTNGSIKEYKEISSAQTANGTYSVTLSATVSLPNLITYAKNHGSECEFAGNTFGMEMRLFEIQKENERKALLNLNSQLRGILSKSLKWRIDIKEPRVISSGIHDMSDNIFDEEMSKKLATQNDTTINNSLFRRIKEMRYDDFFEVSMDIYAIMPENDFVYETLKGLTLSREAFESYQTKGLDVYGFNWPDRSGGYDENTLYFRNNRQDIGQLMDSIYQTIALSMMDFVITDNLGKKHYLYPEEIFASTNEQNCEFELFSSLGFYYGNNINVVRNFRDNRGNITLSSISDESLFAYPIDIYATGNYYDGFNGILKGGYQAISVHKPVSGSEYPLGGFTIYIPKSKIGKYSSFKIAPKE